VLTRSLGVRHLALVKNVVQAALVQAVSGTSQEPFSSEFPEAVPET
jgi:hypothetical protein